MAATYRKIKRHHRAVALGVRSPQHHRNLLLPRHAHGVRPNAIAKSFWISAVWSVMVDKQDNLRESTSASCAHQDTKLNRNYWGQGRSGFAVRSLIQRMPKF
jgi:hypothetical protein